ncbi:alpha/beta hydrolase [Patescibacteria group bacterium]|nr:alpha/beta hydrolase [Patescibacteria group bacterium]
MTNIFIIHGVGGHNKENWFPWLENELKKLGHKVIIPNFPTPQNQTLSAWLNKLEQYKQYLTPETIMVGHSLGVPFVLNVLEKHPLKAAFLVSGFTGKAGNEFDESMKTFAQKPFDWDLIKQNCPHFEIFHSDNDPYIKLEKAQELADHLNVKINLIKGGGHLNVAAGYKSFDLLLKKIKPFL